MRPYFAIIKDSFREALASRVLWVLLLLITLTLAGLFPFHWKSTIASKLVQSDVISVRSISNKLAEGQQDDASPLAKHLWDGISDRTKKHFSELTHEGHPRAFRARELVARDLNELIEQDDFFQDDLWADITLSRRAKKLQEAEDLAGAQLQQFNRLALESALPGQIRPCPDEAMAFGYAIWELDFLPSLRRQDATAIIDQFLLQFMGIFVGFVGIFVGILVTSPIMPDMLNSGSLYVLLSKPIARPLLFVAKFIGGCSFVLINAAYLIVGLWLILGFRFGLWKPEMLWSIPIFLFSFAIYYSVSALTGVVWRSPILAVGFTVAFWATCLTVGLTKELMEQLAIVPTAIRHIVPTQDHLFVVKQNGEFSLWDEATGELLDVFEDPEAARRRGPEMMFGATSTLAGIVFDEVNDRLVVLDRKWAQANVISGTESSRWSRESSSGAPANASALFLLDDTLITVADDGVYRVSFDGEGEQQSSSIFGLIRIPAPQSQDADLKISADIGKLPGNAKVALNANENDILIFGNGQLARLNERDGLFHGAAQVELEIPAVTKLAAGGELVALTSRREDLIEVVLLDGKELTQQSVIATSVDDEVRQLEMSLDGRWLAVLFDNDELKLYDLTTNAEIRSIPARHATAAIQISGNRLVTADVNYQIRTIELGSFNVERTIRPSVSIARKLYRYLVNPLYLVFPKPSQLQNTMQFAITGKDTKRAEGPGLGSEGRTLKLNPYQPLYSNSIFIGVMLLVGCVYVFRQDF